MRRANRPPSAARPKPMDEPERTGLLLPGSRRPVLTNRLALLVPVAGQNRLLTLADLGRSTVRRIAIGDATVPAGDYARQALASLDLSETVAERLVPPGSARAVAAGNIDAGLVNANEARHVGEVRVAALAPPRGHAPARIERHDAGPPNTACRAWRRSDQRPIGGKRTGGRPLRTGRGAGAHWESSRCG